METQSDSTPGAGTRGRDTIFRIAARSQIELIAIADNKANMLIGISVVLISLVIALLGSGFAIQGIPVSSNPKLLIPFCVLLFFALSSAVCAVAAAKPQIIKTGPKSSHSLLFFQNIYNKSQETYLEEMHKLLKDKKAIYDQLIIDMHNNGIVLHRKYMRLSVAYLLFLLGLVLSVITFAVTTFLL